MVFLAPAVLIYTVFMIFPLFDSLRLACSRDGGGAFVGLDNYATLLTDPIWAPRFWGALRNNLVFFAIHMLVQNPIGPAAGRAPEPAGRCAAATSTAR